MGFLLLVGYRTIFLIPYAGKPSAGDEAKSLNETWLFLLWTSDFSPYLTDSLASRNVMCVLPAQHYVITPDGVNLTIQAVTHAIVQSWNLLSNQGLPVRDLPSRGGAEEPGLGNM